MDLFKKLIAYSMYGQLSKLDKLYQRNLGEECYIFGDGVSLKWMDLRQFSDRPSILGNMSLFHKEAPALNAPYCTIIEPSFFWPFSIYHAASGRRIIKNFVHREYRKSIIQNCNTLFLINFSNYPFARFSNALYVSRFYEPPFEKNNPFIERTDTHDGTIKFQLSLAIYLGFKKAYLVGHDYTHSPSRSLHFYEKGEGILTERKDFIRDFFDYVKKNIDLVTVTLDGKSDTMPYVTYKDLTGKFPRFRENTEIVDRDKLLNLATWSGYSIF